MKCPNCGTENEDHARVCKVCGESLLNPMDDSFSWADTVDVWKTVPICICREAIITDYTIQFLLCFFEDLRMSDHCEEEAPHTGHSLKKRVESRSHFQKVYIPTVSVPPISYNRIGSDIG